nr:MAG TPA: Protease subunit of ATP-dependent Clp protease [Caudoviricetes sp.]
MSELNFEKTVVKKLVGHGYIISINGKINWGNDEHNKLIKDLKTILANSNEEDCLSLHLNTTGGCTYGMSEIIQLVKLIPARLGIYVSGSLMSAGADILAALLDKAEHIEIAEETAVMFHSAFDYALGKPDEIMDYAKHFTKLNKVYCKPLKKILTKKQYKKVVKREKEVWMTGKDLYKLVKKAYPDKEIHLAEF